MPKFPGDAHQMARYINGVLYRGLQDFDTRDECKAAAKKLRENGVLARAITIPEGFRMNMFMAAPERYIVYVSTESKVQNLYQLMSTKEES